jgi:raffinose/stachyose/melibiose transport system substrate-binding protein
MRHGSRSRLVTAAACAVALTVAASCGGDDDGGDADTSAAETTADPATGAAPTTEGGEAPATTTGEPVTLEVADFAWGDGYTAAMDAIDAAFMEANPNITIERSGAPYTEHFTKVRTAVAARDGFDVTFTYPGLFAADFSEGFVALDELFEADPVLSTDLRFVEESRGPDGKLYALPHGAYAYMFVANKALLEQAGLDRDMVPQTFEELLGMCDSLSAAGITPFAAGWQDGFYYDWFQFVFTNQTISRDELSQMVRQELPFDSEGFRLAEEYFKQMVDRGCFDENAIAVPNGEVYDAWQAGQAAMYLAAGSYGVAPGEIPAEDLGVFTLPELDDNRWGGYPSTDAGPNGGWAIANWSEHQDAAWKYISYVLSPEAQEIMWEVGEGASAPNSTAAAVTSDDPLGQQYLDILAEPENHTTFLSMPNSVQTAHQKAAVPFISGDISVDDVLEQIETERQRTL